MISISIKEGENINFLNNYLFLKLFGESGCEENILYMISSFTEKKFTSLIYIPNEMKGLHEDNKKSIVDVLSKMNDGTIVNIEAQRSIQKDFHKRSHFYSCKIVSTFLFVGDTYEKLPMMLTINILDFNLFKTENYHGKHIIWDEISKKQTIKDVAETHYIELPKFRKELRKNKLDLNDPKVRLI